MVANAMTTATTASISQTATQRVVSSGGPEMTAATTALTPINTPPHPGTAVNAPARSIVSRMKRRFSIACAWIGSGRPAIEHFIAQRRKGLLRAQQRELLGSQQENRDLDQMSDFVGGRAVQNVGEKAMAVRGHRDEIDPLFLGGFDQLGRGIAHRQLGADRQAARDEVAPDLLEVGAIGPHFLR